MVHRKNLLVKICHDAIATAYGFEKCNVPTESSMDFKFIFFFGFQIGSRYVTNVGANWETGDFQSQNNFPFQAAAAQEQKVLNCLPLVAISPKNMHFAFSLS